MLSDLRSDPERTAKVIDILMNWYYGPRDGLLSGAELPESRPPEGIKRSSYEHIMFLTLTVAIDYQRSAAQLWDASRKTWEDPDTRWVFSPSQLAERNQEELEVELSKYRLSKKREKDARIWGTVGISFFNLFKGDPRNLFEQHGYDAPDIYKAMRSKYGKNFPYLAGSTGTSKILLLWLRILRDEARINFKNLNNIPIPIDIHTARSTITTGCLVGKYEGPWSTLVSQALSA